MTTFVECSHPKSEPRRRTKTNGIDVVSLQCLECGASLRELPKVAHNVNELQVFDPEIRNAYDERLRAAWRTQSEARPTDDAEWWARYNAYLKTDHWRQVRNGVLNRDGWCQVCFSLSASQAHHISYKTFNLLGISFAIECVGVCAHCHKKLHPVREA